MIWIGLAIVILTFYLIYKNYEARLVLALSGILMAGIGWLAAGSNVTIGTAVDAFVKQLVNGGLVPTIVTVMGFGAVMTYTHCSDHLVNALVRPLTHVPASCDSRGCHHHLASEYRATVSCGRCSRGWRASDSFSYCSSREPGDGSGRRVPWDLGLRDQPGADVQPAGGGYCVQGG